MRESLLPIANLIIGIRPFPLVLQRVKSDKPNAARGRGGGLQESLKNLAGRLAMMSRVMSEAGGDCASREQGVSCACVGAGEGDGSRLTTWAVMPSRGVAESKRGGDAHLWIASSGRRRA